MVVGCWRHPVSRRSRRRPFRETKPCQKMPIGRVGAAALRIEQSLETISTRILARGHAPAEKSQRKAFTKPRSRGKLCAQRCTERSGSKLIRNCFLPRHSTCVSCAGAGELVADLTHESHMVTRPAGLSTGDFADLLWYRPPLNAQSGPWWPAWPASGRHRAEAYP